MIDRKQAIAALENISFTKAEAERVLDSKSELERRVITKGVQDRVKRGVRGNDKRGV